MVATVLLTVSLVSVLALGVYDHVRARALLTEAIEAQLENQQGARVRALRDGLAGVGDAVAVIAGDRATVDALTTMATAYRGLEEQGQALTPQETAELESFHGQQGGGAETMPASAAGAYVQYHYVASNPLPAGRRDELAVAAGDTSTYGRAHADLHPTLDEVRSALNFEDLLLVDAASGEIVYTAEKRVDLGTDLTAGPYRATGVATAVNERLPGAAVGETTLVDFSFYPPADGRPVMVAAAAVSDGSDVIGAVVTEIGVEALNAITTSDGQWERTGLSDTGETYVVGPDRLLRSDARGWLEDPDAHLEALSASGASEAVTDAVAERGTTVLTQPAETSAVEAAFADEPFVGRSDDPLGVPSFTVAGPAGAPDLDWVVVAEIDAGEGGRALSVLTRRLAALALVLVPLVIAVGLLVADRIARVVQPVASGAAAVAAGDLDTQIGDLGRNEIGDVGRRLDLLTAELRAQRRARERQEHQITELLASVLPPRLVDRLRRGEVRIGDLTDTATVIAVTVGGPLEESAIDRQRGLELAADLAGELESIAAGLGVERVRSASSRHLFAAGLGEPDTAADRAAAFAWATLGAVERFAADTGIPTRCHAGMSAGEVASGLLDDEPYTYAVLGEPTRRAMALDALAADGQVLVDAGMTTELEPGWILERPAGLVELRGEQLGALLLLGPREPPAPGAGPAMDGSTPVPATGT